MGQIAVYLYTPWSHRLSPLKNEEERTW